jgi:HAD superfamily hydrolase (TIGR01459 family)
MSELLPTSLPTSGSASGAAPETVRRPLHLPFEEVAERHEAVLFDAYGVLVDASGALPGAAEAVQYLLDRDRPFLVVTNDASRSPARASARLMRLGIPVAPEHVMSSGMLIGPALSALGMAGETVVVLGTGDSAQYARDMGAVVVAPNVQTPARAVVIADEGGFDGLDSMDELLSMILAACEAGRPPHLLLANPDLVYPASAGRFGFTAGSLAHMLERALQLLLGDVAPRFTVLGKPAVLHFDTALSRLGTRDAVMLGDTLHTDIAGAAGVGIASALLLTGVTTQAHVDAAVARGDGGQVPTYVVRGLIKTV